MKFHVFAASVVLAMAGLVQEAEAGCFVDKEAGPRTCNCTDQVAKTTLCTGSAITASSDERAGGTFYGPGFSASAGVKYSESVSVTDSSCSTLDLPPNTCMWWVYRVKVCAELVLVEGLLWDYFEWQVTATFDGASIHSGPAGPDDC